MFDFDAGKLLIIGVIALIVIGPKELPRVLRQVGQVVGRMRRMAAEFQGQFMDAMKEADLQSIREEIDKVSRESALDTAFDPVRDIRNELTRTLDDKPAGGEAAAPAEALETTAAHGPAEGFALPAPEVEGAETLAVEEAPPGEAAATLAAAGLAPVVDAAPESVPVAPLAPGRKRKILLPKRVLRRNPHEVWDRTGLRKGRAAGLVR